MNASKPFIHLFKTPGAYYFYDVNRNANVRIQEPVWRELSRRLKNSAMPPAEDFSPTDSQADRQIQRLHKDGFLSSNHAKEIQHPNDETVQYHLDNKVEKITLQVTRQCNLRCDYCAYSGGYYNRFHENTRMTLETAKKSIDFLIEHSSDNDLVNIGFYGGEPLIEFELIKQCIAYAEAKSHGKKLYFSITTNGTLLEDKLDYFNSHDIYITISLDGPREIHDQTRRTCNNEGSYDKVMHVLHIINNQYPQLFKRVMINAVVNPNNDFGCINDFFDHSDMVKDINSSMSIITDQYARKGIKLNEDFVVKNEYEHFKVMLSKLGRLDKKHISRLIEKRFDDLKKMYDHTSLTTKLPHSVHHGGPCLPGVQRLFVTVNGEFLPCERVSETSEMMNIGNATDGFDLEQVRQLLNIGKITDKQCLNCWAFRHCYMCAAFADDLKELSAAKKLAKCQSVRLYVEALYKDICTLREMGYSFRDTDNNYSIGVVANQ